MCVFLVFCMFVFLCLLPPWRNKVIYILCFFPGLNLTKHKQLLRHQVGICLWNTLKYGEKRGRKVVLRYIAFKFYIIVTLFSVLVLALQTDPTPCSFI